MRCSNSKDCPLRRAFFVKQASNAARSSGWTRVNNLGKERSSSGPTPNISRNTSEALHARGEVLNMDSQTGDPLRFTKRFFTLAQRRLGLLTFRNVLNRSPQGQWLSLGVQFQTSAKMHPPDRAVCLPDDAVFSVKGRELTGKIALESLRHRAAVVGMNEQPQPLQRAVITRIDPQ